MENFKKLKQLIETSEKDAEKFYKLKNKTAGTRLRNAMQKAKVLAQEIRIEVLEIKSKNI
jgi:hypothetical protein